MTGFQSPNYTQVPNDLFDEIMRDMEGAELKVILAIVRLTVGYHREEVKCSIPKLAAITGLSRNGTKAAAKAAQERGLIERLNPNAQGSAEWGLILTRSVSDPSGGQSVPPPRSVSDPQVRLKESTKDNKINTTTDAAKNVYQLYEENIGALTPLIADKLRDAESIYPPSWFADAISISVDANVRRWDYIEAILNRWRVRGKDDGQQKSVVAIGKSKGKDQSLIEILKSEIAEAEAV